MQTHQAKRPGTGLRRDGLTLVEMVMSMVIMMALVAGVSSAFMVASRAVDDQGASAQVSSAVSVLHQMTEDIGLALAFSERTSTAIEFTVPDRDGDLAPETIRYAWSPTPGNPLTREYNGGSPFAILNEVRNLDLDYLLRTEGPPIEACCYSVLVCEDEFPSVCVSNGGAPQGEGSECQTLTCPDFIESDEVVLAFHDDAPGGNMVTFTSTNSAWTGTYFAPILPTNAFSWKINRAEVRAKGFGIQDGVSYVQIRPEDGSGLPTNQVLGQGQLHESVLSPLSFTWVSVSFSSISGLGPAEAFCLILEFSLPSFDVMMFQQEEGSTPMTVNAHQVETFNGGDSWQSNANTDLRFYIYGTYTTIGPPEWP